MLLLIILLILLLGGGGGYYGYGRWGYGGGAGIGLGTILLILLIVYILGGFQSFSGRVPSKRYRRHFHWEWRRVEFNVNPVFDCYCFCFTTVVDSVVVVFWLAASGLVGSAGLTSVASCGSGLLGCGARQAEPGQGRGASAGALVV